MCCCGKKQRKRSRKSLQSKRRACCLIPDKCEHWRQWDKKFIVISGLALLATVCLLTAMLLDLTYGPITNRKWKRILHSKSPFISLSGERTFAGRYLNPVSKSTSAREFMYRAALERDSDHEFASALMGLLLICEFLLYVPPLLRKRHRRGPYLVILELSFGLLACSAIAGILMINFANGEYYSDSAQVLNLFGEAENTKHYPRDKLPLAECPEDILSKNSSKAYICLHVGTWQSIIAKCLLHNKATIAKKHELTSNMISIYQNYKPFALQFEGSDYKYSYSKLKKLGFCPYSEIRKVAAGLLIATIILFLAIAFIGCLIGTTEVDDKDDEDEFAIPEEVEAMETQLAKIKKSWGAINSRGTLDQVYGVDQGVDLLDGQVIYVAEDKPSTPKITFPDV